MDISPVNSSKMAVATVDHLWRSINGGATWLDITSNIPVQIQSGRLIMDITYHNTVENTFWINLSGYSTNRVFKTTDNGSTFSLISDGLPNVPTDILVQNNLVTTYDELYIATEAGVFVKIGDQPWLPFNNNMPKVDCNGLAIYYDGTGSRLRCGTWGRGVWESDLFSIGSGVHCIWTGTSSNDWWDANNWSFYTVPDANSYVGIPEGCPNYPVVTGSYVTVKELTVYPNATLNIGANLVTVNENVHMYGSLIMSDNSSALRVLKDLTWYAGSIVDIQGTSASIQVERDLVFNSGTILDFSNSTVFMGGGTYDSEIIINSPSISFNKITLDKSSFRIVTFSSTYGLNKLKVLGNFTIFPNNHFLFDSPADFFLTGSFTNYGSFEFLNGAFKYAGGSTNIAGNSYCYFNDLVIDGNTSTYLTLDFDATIAGDLEIIHGSIDPLTYDLYIYGDWNN